MEIMKLRSHIGTDGLLLLQMPAEFKDTSVEVVVVVQVLSSEETKSQYNAWGKLSTKKSIALLQSLLIHVDEATHTNALSSTLALGRQEGIAAYDAAYLELALRLELPSATLDSRLAEAATRCGVELVVVDG